ncbi:Protein of unknown function [Oryzisolibacter propanilivorax]|uniref:DUF421 domain-containing protein n=1 Tax=Oryzisolibacter propanilivorax TaxID=1527607 RepID=A0A1G9PDH6_9BURK|nr:YetF domain-containing protein [Oryzisolibacter propanilivorax]SDL96856.1 Protein of unknown function [Oryzisolibacter propanilivorax]
MFFNSWMDLLHVAVVGVLVYFGLILSLRLAGKRTLSKWNAFDMVITVALGSTLSSAFLSKDVSLAQGLAAIVVMVALQFAISWTMVRSARVRGVVKARPTLLFDRGEFLEGPMRTQRVTHSEIRAAIRGAGHAALEDVEAVVLETNGDFSVLRRVQQPGERTALCDVEGAGQ